MVNRYIILATATVIAVVAVAAIAIARHHAARRAVGAGGSGDDLARAGRTRDARGRVVKLLDPVPLYLLKRHDVIDAEALQGIITDVEPGMSSRRKTLLLVAMLGSGALAFIAAAVAIEGAAAWSDLLGTLLKPAIMPAVIVGVIAPVLAAWQERLRRVRRIMLRHRRCPHCGYGLIGVPAAEDGATVCPECACPWRLDATGGVGAVGPATRAPATITRTVLLIAAALGTAAVIVTVIYVIAVAAR